MEVIILPSPEEASKVAARLVARVVRDKPTAVLGLATGSTPLRLYRELIALHQADQLDFSKTSTFNLDEYVGLATDRPQSYAHFMQENLFNHVNIPPDQTHIPDGMAANVPGHCAEYERAIQKAGGIDLQVLGIGSDGHIGFNEPVSSLSSRTRIKTLTRRTRADNAPYFGSEDAVPHHVITMGIGTIMESRGILLMAFGEKKADAIAKTVEGPLTALVPGSALQMHVNAKVIIDEAAASKLTRTDYYKWVYDNKPDWQKF